MKTCVPMMVALTLAACGPSTAERREAVGAAYQTDFKVVLKAVLDEMHDRFPDKIKVADDHEGYVETQWTSNMTDEAISAPCQGPRCGNQITPGVVLFRMLVKIREGGPPWTIDIDGQAAEYRPGFKLIQPFKHGVIDEPAWVPERIEKVRLAIYQRLKPYATRTPPGP